LTIKGYHFDNLDQNELDKIKSLEMDLNEKRKENNTDKEELLLLAFSEEK
jgi:hypothetical protein